MLGKDRDGVTVFHVGHTMSAGYSFPPDRSAGHYLLVFGCVGQQVHGDAGGNLFPIMNGKVTADHAQNGGYSVIDLRQTKSVVFMHSSLLSMVVKVGIVCFDHQRKNTLPKIQNGVKSLS